MTTEPPKRSTIYLEPDLHQALKLQAAETSSSLSALVNSALRDALKEDRDDLNDFDERSQESTLSFQELLKRLDLDGQI
jgi:predicted transcriptional regulator